ncbi:diguanylate cyclase [Noviherbaspirillum saxi]|uniref:diguanylate cyclase n=1 Tax=Noviherbaspirillum saxi TaxID=2320863 RepID=A0A3A3G555_9BURK|nr:diguanylate cyclase [Noviherbaspirillum saxi]RJF97265.1 diguanylate cyclase [Noviherbaspirillum saxi]
MDPQQRSGDDLEHTLKAIEASYTANLPTRLDDIEYALQRYIEDLGNDDHCNSLLIKLHELAGSAGTFGYPRLGLHAAELEKLLSAYLKATAPSGKDFAPVASAVRDLLQWARTDPKGDDTVCDIAATAPHTPVAESENVANRLIYLVHDNLLIATDIAAQFTHFGYEVRVIAELGQLQACIDQRVPAAVVMDLGFPAGILGGAAEIARIRAASRHRFAVIFLSTRSNFEARLVTVRAGADGYFSKPLDMVALIDRLDRLIERDEERAYRVLVVDDEVETADFYAAVLRGAGMEVRLLHQVSDMLRVMGEYRPELVLMDVYMPDCNGVDLARIIRQDTMYLDVPIVFLSSEGNLDNHLDAIASGADDFLTKPIQPLHLVSALTSRAKRYRELRGLIMRDSLTGLFNHSAIKEHLVREMSIMRRMNKPLSLVMLDIDHFKRVNDTYGHPIGDQVIRALSRLLQQRLRRSDIIGRYGGEEFAVIMPHTPIDAAVTVMDEIRESFCNIRHHAEHQDFTAAFSAGSVELAADLDADDLFRLADAALYQAKGGGRNRVVKG